MTRKYEDTGDIPYGAATPDWDSHGISLSRLCRLYPNLTLEQLVALAGDAFLLMHRHSRRLTSAPSRTTVSHAAERIDTGGSVIVAYPLMRRPNSDRSVVCIGRLDGNDVAIMDPTVSKYHAFARVDGGVHVIQDANSRNGTFVDDVPVPKRGEGPPTPLRENNLVRFGGVITTFVHAKTIVELAGR